ASGGPFRTREKEMLEGVTLEQALKHPTWVMGRKITIDSATMFNKGLEMIEARWLFGVGMERVEVIVHPQSIVHSMVEFVDGSVLAQLSTTDMCFPIQYAVTWPERCENQLKPLDFAELAKLEFEAPREDVFPAVRLAREAGLAGGGLPAVLNAANEVAVEAFVEGRLSFTGISGIVEGVMEKMDGCGGGSLEELVAVDGEARGLARTLVG
ncbi:MAG: 1-deoxy-D-xylulose-5-phosphate reductoisomerase, partial [Verrucomicrobiota bacterium]